MTLLLTLGHGTASQEELTERLRAAEIRLVVDVRIAPGSKRHPHVARDALAEWLPQAGVSYRWEKRLGGFRKLAADSPDTALRNESFRAYAGYMRTTPFVDAVDALLADAAHQCVAIMCSETVWWRCHRRLVADHLVLARGAEVRHVMPANRVEAHAPTDGVRVASDGRLYYDAGASTLPGVG
jgi:uncharacterized protein (DUF488 family)